MKEKIAAAIRLMYKNMGFSDKAVEGVSTYLETTVDADDKIEAAVKGMEGMLKAFQSEVDTRVTTAVAKAKEKPADPAKPEPVVEPTPALPADTPAWAKALIDQNKILTDKVLAIETGKSTDTRKSQLDEVLKDTPDAYKNAIANAFPLMKFEKEEDFTTYLDKLKTDSAAFVQETANNGLSQVKAPIKPAGGDKSKQATKEELDAVMSNLTI